MKNNTSYGTDFEYKDSGSSTRTGYNKFNFELYDEEKDKAENLFRIKRTGVVGKTEKWKLFQNDEILLVIDGEKILKKEKEFLRTIDGINFLLDQCKIGTKSLNSLKKNLKKIIK